MIIGLQSAGVRPVVAWSVCVSVDNRLGLSAEYWQLLSTSTIAIVIITQPVSWYSFYLPTEGRRLSRPRHCSSVGLQKQLTGRDAIWVTSVGVIQPFVKITVALFWTNMRCFHELARMLQANWWDGVEVTTRAFQFRQKSFDSILATESIFSIQQSDKFDACTLIFK